MRLLQTLRIVVALGALSCLCPSQTYAYGGPVVAVPAAASQTVTAEPTLADLKKMCQARNRLKAFHLRYSSGFLTVTGDLQRPNKMNLRILNGTTFMAQVISDGATLTIYNPVNNNFEQYGAPRSFDPNRLASGGILQRLLYFGPLTTELNEDASFDDFTRASLNRALRGAVFWLASKTPDRISPEDLDVFGASASNVLDQPIGQSPAVIFDETGNAVDLSLHLDCDPISGLPTSYRAEISFAGWTMLCDFDHARVTPIAGAFPDKAFAWTAPRGATPYVLPRLNDPDGINPRLQLIGPVL